MRQGPTGTQKQDEWRGRAPPRRRLIKLSLSEINNRGASRDPRCIMSSRVTLQPAYPRGPVHPLPPKSTQPNSLLFEILWVVCRLRRWPIRARYRAWRHILLPLFVRLIISRFTRAWTRLLRDIRSFEFPDYNSCRGAPREWKTHEKSKAV